MKIIEIETIPVDQYLFVVVHTDEGLTGRQGHVGWTDTR